MYEREAIFLVAYHFQPLVLRARLNFAKFNSYVLRDAKLTELIKLSFVEYKGEIILYTVKQLKVN